MSIILKFLPWLCPLRKLLASFHDKNSMGWVEDCFSLFGKKTCRKKLQDQQSTENQLFKKNHRSSKTGLYLQNTIYRTCLIAWCTTCCFNWLHNRAFGDVDALLTVECIKAVMLMIRSRSYLWKGYVWNSGLNGPIWYERVELFSVTRKVMGHHTYPCCILLWSTNHGRHLVSLWNIKGRFRHLQKNPYGMPYHVFVTLHHCR